MLSKLGRRIFAGLNADIISSIYNALINNQEQYNRGNNYKCK